MMCTTRAVYDIEIQEALQNNVSSVTYRNTQNTCLLYTSPSPRD